jgi:pimeloyl-ACP methyl ester carboxylesterase
VPGDAVAPPKLLFLPGALGAASFWRPVGEQLPAEWEKVYLSWPGLGSEPASPSVNSFRDCVPLVEAHLDRPADVIAHSMGGVVALLAALRNPGRIRRLVLTATSGGVDLASFGGAEWRDDYRAANPGAAAWALDEVSDLTTDIRRLSVSTLLLWGDRDPISPVSVGGHLASLLQDATLHVVSGGAHSFPADHPETVAALIRGHCG